MTAPLCLLAIIATACVNRTEVNTARRSLYDTEFARVYNAAVEAVRAEYPHFDEDPTLGKISTAWRQVQFTNQADDPRSRQSNPTTGFNGTGGGMTSTSTEALSSRRYFVRFDVTVSGNRPWRVRVVGHASEWRAGDAMPSPLRGAAIPSWLPAREDGLVVSIYRALKAYAIAAPNETPITVTSDEPTADPTKFAAVPAAAATSLAALRLAVTKRDYPAVRALLDDDVVWSAGAAPGAAGAMVILQADPSRLDRVGAALDAGCAGDAEVVCGDNSIGSARVVLVPHGTGYVVTQLD